MSIVEMSNLQSAILMNYLR